MCLRWSTLHWTNESDMDIPFLSFDFWSTITFWLPSSLLSKLPTSTHTSPFTCAHYCLSDPWSPDASSDLILGSALTRCHSRQVHCPHQWGDTMTLTVQSHSFLPWKAFMLISYKLILVHGYTLLSHCRLLTHTITHSIADPNPCSNPLNSNDQQGIMSCSCLITGPQLRQTALPWFSLTMNQKKSSFLVYIFKFKHV